MRLVLDSSSLNLSLGLYSDDKGIVRVVNLYDKKPQQSKLLFQAVEELLLKENIGSEDITELAIGIGPGSYTGLRVGMSFVKTWAFSKSISVFSFRSDSLLEKTLQREPDTDYPKVDYLEKNDFQTVSDLSQLKPIYKNDHFA